MAGHSVGRSLLQAPPQSSVKAPLVVKSTAGQPCILLWADTLLASYSGKQVDLARDIFNGSADTTGSVCNENLSRSESQSTRNQYTFQYFSMFSSESIKYFVFQTRH